MPDTPLPCMPTTTSSDRARIVVAGHFIRSGRVGGAEPMLYNMLHGFAQLGVDTTLLCGQVGHLAPNFVAQAGGRLGIHEAGGSGNRFAAEQRACMLRELAAEAILFPNYFVPPVVPRRFGRVAVVMHDFQYRHFPEHFALKKRLWLRAAQEFAVRRADRVIVISDFVRQDALRLFGRGLAGKLVTIPNAICWDRFSAGVDRPRPIASPYLLTVAAHYPHKNIETVVRAFKRVADADRDVQLVLCGQSYAGLHGVAAGRGSGADVASLVTALGLERRVRFTGHVDDATLGQWYRHAEMFLFPSLFEGFGMPPVEALGFGLPTLVTRRTALPEVTRGLARTVSDACDAAEWAAAILDILRDPAAHRPGEVATSELRAFYHPTRIAGAYLSALIG